MSEEHEQVAEVQPKGEEEVLRDSASMLAVQNISKSSLCSIPDATQAFSNKKRKFPSS
jgi:hypothetical protein